ncbi:MAG TPA: alpha/beta fold hydrolase [Nitrososphaerales archaeon]|nr:alpha/beta fold hydrolase [Nitrososphaerales archaeon]
MSVGKQGAARAVDETIVDVGEYKVNVASAGSGTAVVLLHGEDKRPGWKEWEGFLGLAESHRLIVPDLVGFGGSSHPSETPDYRAQARVIHELLDVMKVDKAALVGYSWGGQVALEVAIDWPEKVDSLILVASTYDKGQLPKLSKLRKPSLIVWAEDDLVTQLKAGYLLRDAIRTSRLEVLPPVAKDPKHDFTFAHSLLVSRREELLKLFRSFLASPASATAEPPELEKELRGMAMKQDGEES